MRPSDPAGPPADLAHRTPRDSARLLVPVGHAEAIAQLQGLRPAAAVDVLDAMEMEQRAMVLAAASPQLRAQWSMNLAWPPETIGRLMETPAAVFPPTRTVAESIEELRERVKQVFITYGFIVDDAGVLVGVITFRDLLLSERKATLGEIMLTSPFALHPETDLQDAMKQVVNRHFPVYPVVDDAGRLVGEVRGQVMFEERVIDISLQAGTMVGLAEEERLTTPWKRSLKFRHPWLQLNLLTAFVAAAVVGVFQGTIDRLVILAMFLPVLAGQSGNTGCQALAVTLRGMTLGEMKKGTERALVTKEALLGLLNGSFVGISAGLGMFLVARAQSNPNAITLALSVWLAMIGSCVISGLSGALIPLTLRRLGADPATASSIFLTTATDVASMGMLLSLATILVG